MSTLANSEDQDEMLHNAIFHQVYTTGLKYYFACFVFLSSADCLKLTFSKASLRNIIRVSKILDPYQAQCLVRRIVGILTFISMINNTTSES